jgi:hypothetical protein
MVGLHLLSSFKPGDGGRLERGTRSVPDRSVGGSVTAEVRFAFTTELAVEKSAAHRRGGREYCESLREPIGRQRDGPTSRAAGAASKGSPGRTDVGDSRTVPRSGRYWCLNSYGARSPRPHPARDDIPRPVTGADEDAVRARGRDFDCEYRLPTSAVKSFPEPTPCFHFPRWRRCIARVLRSTPGRAAGDSRHDLAGRGARSRNSHRVPDRRGARGNGCNTYGRRIVVVGGGFLVRGRVSPG